MEHQLQIPTLSSSYVDLMNPHNTLVNYFRSINIQNITPIMRASYPGPGPSGYGVSLFLSRILKVKQTFVSDRVLANRLSENETYRVLCNFNDGRTPSNCTYTIMRRHLGVEGYRSIHVNFVNEAYSLGILQPHISALPKTMRSGLILIGDSTPIPAYCSTKGTKQPDGSWLFTDPSVSFGRPHHRDKYPVGHKAHSLITITSVPTVSIVTTRSDSDQNHIFPLLDEFKKRFPELTVAYLVLDAGYDAEPIHKSIYEDYNIIPIIIRKKIVYPKGFNSNGTPLCDLGYPLTRTGIDYTRKRNRYECRRICQRDPQMILFCPYRSVSVKYRQL